MNLKKQLPEYELAPITKSNFKQIFEVYDTNQDYNVLAEGKKSTIESSMKNIDEVPPNFDIKQKVFVSIWKGNSVYGVLDFLIGYPDKTCVWIGLLMIHGKLHGQKIGSKIASAVENAAKIGGYKSIQIAVLENNTKGLAFWRKHGYERIRDKGNRIVMEKRIN